MNLQTLRSVNFQILLFMILALNGYSQIVPSSCEAPDSVIEKYYDDAQRLAVRRMLNSNTGYADSINIPIAWTDTSLDALIAVYNATQLAARDTVVQFLNIHTWPIPLMNRIYMQVDTNYAWANELSQGNLLTGNNTIDGLLAEHGMSIIDINFFSFGVYIVLATDSNYNLSALSSAFMNVAGVLFAEPDGVIGDGANITDSVSTTVVKLFYSYGWGDCFAGCIQRRFWQFNIYHDCEVEFAGSYGDPIDFPIYTEINALVRPSIRIYPNPAIDYISVEGILPEKILIENLSGQTVRTISGHQSEIPLTNLEKGIYIIKAYSKEGVCFTAKFVRE